MKDFFALLSRYGTPCFHPAEFKRRIGSDVYAALRRERVIIDLPLATWYECGGFDGSGCPRYVLHQPTESHPDRPYIACCGNERPHCGSVRISAADLEQVEVSNIELGRLLGRLYGVDDPSPSPTFPRAFEIGRMPNGRDLVFAPTPWLEGFEALLLARRTSTTVLAPTRSRAPAALVQRYAPGERVELRFLDDEIALVEGRLRLRGSGAADAAVAQTARLVIDHRGERAVADAEYRGLVAQRATLDLFLDLSAPVAAGQCMVHVRDAEGRTREVTLSVKRAHVLVELARTRAPVRPKQLRTAIDGEVFDAEQLVERMRKAIDTKIGRTSWHFIKTIAGVASKGKHYEFAPPPDASFAFILPIT